MKEHGHSFIFGFIFGFIVVVLGLMFGGHRDSEQDERIDALETRIAE